MGVVGERSKGLPIDFPAKQICVVNRPLVLLLLLLLLLRSPARLIGRVMWARYTHTHTDTHTLAH
jgi:hypothetical protein